MLASGDYDVPAFLDKVERFSPRVVAFNGKEAARRVFRHLGHLEPALGRSDIQLGGTQVFVLPSSSGANAERRNLAPKSSKVEWWRELGDHARGFAR